MTDSREFNASTVEEAVSKAAASLGTSEGDLSYEVLDSGSDGFLGIGARDARISVSVTEDVPGDVTPSDSAEHETEDSRASIVEPASETPEPSDAFLPDEARISAEHSDTDSESEEESREVVEAPAELVEEVRGHVSSVFEAMGIEVRIDVYDTDDYIAVDVASDHTALIIGQKGETIDSLQYLANSAIYRDREFVKRIVLDSEGYRQRRIEAIQGMAHRTARKSIREDRDIQMPPMNSSERRVVHVYLKDTPGVTTFSEGTGKERRVTVSPD